MTSSNEKIIRVEGEWYKTKGVDTDFLREGGDYIFEITTPVFFDRYISGFKQSTEEIVLPKNLI